LGQWNCPQGWGTRPISGSFRLDRWQVSRIGGNFGVEYAHYTHCKLIQMQVEYLTQPIYYMIFFHPFYTFTDDFR
jgi:hypothetical protein